MALPQGGPGVNVSTGCRNIVIAMTATAALLLSAGSALGAPRVVSAGFDRATVVGRDLNLSVRAVDSGRPVNGMTVSFGNPAQVFALSACRPAGSDGRAPGGPFAPGAPVTLRAPHRFARAGVQQVVARVDTGGCDAGGESLYQPLTATLTRPGEPAVAPVIGPPVTKPALLPKLPGLPGEIELPGLPVLATVAEAKVAIAAAAQCPGAGTPIGSDAESLRAARAALLCSINVVRRRAGLRGLRANRRLRRAATAHSNSMVARRYFSHIAPSGAVLISRLRRVLR